MVLFLAGLLEMEWYSFCHVYGIKKNTEPPTINQTQELEILLSSLQAILFHNADHCSMKSASYVHT